MRREGISGVTLICVPVNSIRQTYSNWHTYTIPWPRQYLTHAHSPITRAGAAMDSCFTLLVGVCVSFVLSLREMLARLRVGVCLPLAKFNFVLRSWYIFVLNKVRN